MTSVSMPQGAGASDQPPIMRTQSNVEESTSKGNDGATSEAGEGAGKANATAESEKAVSAERKKILLKLARSDRRKWINEVPLPYKTTVRDPNNIWTLDDRLAAFQSSVACRRIPTATKVLSELYGLENHSKAPEEVADRIESVIGPLNEDDSNETDESKSGVKEASEGNEIADDGEMTKAYREFWSTLLRPDCALLVQAMRNFQRSVTKSGSHSIEIASSSIKTFVDSTYESIKSHPSWLGRADDKVRRSLESFLYGQFQPVIEKLEWGGLFSMTEKDWYSKIDQLQFIGPTHLDIGCLIGDDDSTLQEHLAEPIQALLAVNRYYSPREKLQQILRLYKSINESLAGALNKATAGGEKKLPSADDVLPTMILAVLRAKPEHMFRDLQFIESFCPPSYLRGEAGYAYTNLYGAVQFLNDLNMDKPDALSISAEDFRKGLESRKQDVEKRISTVVEASETKDEKTPLIRIKDVRAARLNGAKVDLEWALEKQGVDNGEEEKEGPSTDYMLPKNQARSYSFLDARPEDIKLSDLPLLLDEYRALIKSTEYMVGERASMLVAERRQKVSRKKQQANDNILLGDVVAEAKRSRALTS